MNNAGQEILAVKTIHRPAYHVSPDNWMNDPIPFFWNGEYHVFYQHNPGGAFWGTMHWGHVRSRDLVHWETLPLALTPTPDSPDQAGCWTGCVVRADDEFRLYYTGIPSQNPLQQVQCLACSQDLITWKKRSEPVLTLDAKPPDFGECFRDPCVWRRGDTWFMAVGGERPRRQGGVIFLYQSADGLDWQYVQPLLDTGIDTGHDCECPDLFPLGQQHLLLTSRVHTWWRAGTVTKNQFREQARGMVDGGSFYAGKTCVDDHGRRLLFGWIREARTQQDQVRAGWSGVLSLPREVVAAADGSPGFIPARELTSLRGPESRVGDLTLTAGETPAFYPFPDLLGDCLELDAEFDVGTAAEVGLSVLGSPNGGEQLLVKWDRQTGLLGNTPLHLAPGETLRLRLFVDRSVVEAFANDRACFTDRVYPAAADAVHVAGYVRGGEARLRSLRAWPLRLGG